jgi:hypothetical protein
MAMRGCGTLLKGSGKDQTVWKLEWTYTGTSGEVSLDATQSDEEPSIATPVADSGTTGITNIVFPKCTRAWVLHCSLEPIAADVADPTDYRMVNPALIVATSGTMNVCFSEIETAGALADPNTGARARLILLLERA